MYSYVNEVRYMFNLNVKANLRVLLMCIDHFVPQERLTDYFNFRL